MTEDSSKEQYVKCSRCKKKFINDDEHIKTDFGFNRLGVKYKTCVTCRDRETQRVNKLKQEAEENKDTIKHCYRCYKNKSLQDFICPNGKSYNACYSCLDRRYNDPPKIALRKDWFDRVLEPSTSDEEDAIWGGKRD